MDDFILCDIDAEYMTMVEKDILELEALMFEGDEDQYDTR